MAGQVKITVSGPGESSKRSTNKQVRFVGATKSARKLAGGVLTTDSGLTFVSDAYGNFLALDTDDGRTLWYAGSGATIASSPITHELGGRQYVVTSSGGVLFAWTLPDQ
jgi:glucose dehydrogenase